MSNIVKITLTDALPTGVLREKFTSDNRFLGLANISNHMIGLAAGNYPGSVLMSFNNGDAVQASKLVTITSVAVGDILLVNAVPFTAVASGATGNQFNVGASNTAAATNLAAAINASVTANVAGLVTAVPLTNTVTVKAVSYGIDGNGFRIEPRGSGALAVTGAGVQASATLTFNNAGTATDTLTINGVAFTAVASGATGNQWNVAGTATLSAEAAAVAINASVTSLVSGYVYAVALAGVVTVKAQRAGLFGNTMTLAAGQASITASATRLAGGTDATAINLASGTADTTAKTYSVS